MRNSPQNGTTEVEKYFPAGLACSPANFALPNVNKALDAYRDDAPVIAHTDAADLQSLDDLIAQHWKPLFAHCYLLILNRDRATDLAHSVWRNILRSGPHQELEEKLPELLFTLASDLWRQDHGSQTIPVELMEIQKFSEPLVSQETSDMESARFGERLSQIKALKPDEQTIYKTRIDQALENLPPRLRDALVSRLLIGEPCEEIALRYDQTERTITAWVEKAVDILDTHLRGCESPAAVQVASSGIGHARRGV
jgi:DNA-directed RNA polymerase specialized sigma24 family protein